MADRLFLDANILVSAAWRPDAGLQRLWQIPDVALITSTHAIEEALRNLPRQQQPDRLDSLMASVTIISEWAGVRLPPDVSLPEKDVPILQAAIAAHSTHLISGDLRDFGPYFGNTISGVTVQRPAEYLRHHT